MRKRDPRGFLLGRGSFLSHGLGWFRRLGRAWSAGLHRRTAWRANAARGNRGFQRDRRLAEGRRLRRPARRSSGHRTRWGNRRNALRRWPWRWRHEGARSFWSALCGAAWSGSAHGNLCRLLLRSRARRRKRRSSALAGEINPNSLALRRRSLRLGGKRDADRLRFGGFVGRFGGSWGKFFVGHDGECWSVNVTRLRECQHVCPLPACHRIFWAK